MTSHTKAIVAGSILLAAGLGTGIAVATSQDHIACIDAAGQITWARYSCPSGTTQVPNACDLGYCQECPPEGCPETVEGLMCCVEVSGPDDCFPITATVGECPPNGVLVECDYGKTNPDGTFDCYLPESGL
jgi:hypothetical protein